MSKQLDGGLAFPAVLGVDDYGTAEPLPGGLIKQYAVGMTLRDYFAAAALQGMIAAGISDTPHSTSAEKAYDLANAMVQERENQKEYDKEIQENP